MTRMKHRASIYQYNASGRAEDRLTKEDHASSLTYSDESQGSFFFHGGSSSLAVILSSQEARCDARSGIGGATDVLHEKIAR